MSFTSICHAAAFLLHLLLHLLQLFTDLKKIEKKWLSNNVCHTASLYGQILPSGG